MKFEQFSFTTSETYYKPKLIFTLSFIIIYYNNQIIIIKLHPFNQNYLQVINLYSQFFNKKYTNILSTTLSDPTEEYKPYVLKKTYKYL